jgi:hypothetical protein
MHVYISLIRLSEEKQEVKKKVKRDDFGNVEEEKTEVKKESD